MPHHINTSWKRGEPVEVPHTEMVTVDIDSLPVKERYKLLIGGIIPRPIAFVSTVNSEGLVNLAPFSFFNGVASNPPTLMISIARKPDGSKKDTLNNIEATGEFVVVGANQYITTPLTHCAAEFPSDMSELEITGLTSVPSLKVKPPGIREALIQFECILQQAIEIGDGTAGSATLVLGRIVVVHMEKTAYENGRINPSILKPVSRLGGFNYATLGEVVSIPIPEA